MKNLAKAVKVVLTSLVVTATGCKQAPAEDLSSFEPENIYRRAVENPARFAGDAKRDGARLPAHVLRFAGVKPGMVVIDVLGGGGWYTELLSHIVGAEGKVYLQNNSLFLRFSGEELQKRLANGRLANVVRLDSEFADMKLPKADFIVLGLSYHDIYVPRENPVDQADRDQFFAQLDAALQPEGKILVIDHAAAKGTGKASAAKLHRIEESFAQRDFEAAGYEQIATSNVLRRTDDDYTLDVWSAKVMRKTDRFIHLYQKKPAPEQKPD